MSQRGTHSRDPLAHPGDEVATLLANGSVAVYDPTDKTAMKVGGWEKVEDNPDAVYVTQHLLGHFYLVMRYQ